jgi:xanthine dehydrogenase/oxidase
MDPSKKKMLVANSCLQAVCAMNGAAITTTEGLGGKKSPNGYHEIQTALASHDGSQCGYCSPGMVMSMYGLLAKQAAAGGNRYTVHVQHVGQSSLFF